ncbi:katanin p80 WD40 repeat-containing subunit B1 homolog isoform X2 [Camellia sinensis]|uniref:katanin p80 WD40 repeat-containing subunit B1 homolog isoform X2 n=1 Tax=Camellia sinensis TaxID=4442 RepID=UPI0010367926|nr:katanin p80 WD40 repeat-containing subunit B1 homolog isoform X2 [Camellia sinensis]
MVLEAVSTRMIIMALIMAKAHIHLFTGVVAHMEVGITTRFERLRYLRRWDGRGLVEDCGLLLERKAEISNDPPSSTEGTNSVKLVNGVVQGRTRSLVEMFERRERLNSDEVQAHDTTAHIITETAKTTPMLNRDPQITGRELTSSNDGDLTEDLMQNHDVFLSTLWSRLTKLQVLRHFWDRNDINGAIDAVRKLPDHSVQADLMSILMEKMEILTLDLFSCLLPVLLGLLDSKIERHANISLEMLLKLVAVFGPVVRSTI